MARNKKKPEFLSALGVMFEIWKAVVDAVLAKGGDDDDLRRVKDDKKLADAIAQLIVGAKSVIAKFIVRDHFKVDTSALVAVKISYLGDNFREWFLGKVEEPAETRVPKFHHDLERNSLDEEILADIGGADKAEVTMAGIYELMKRQSKGEAGGLLTKNGHGNIFYVKDVEGVLRAVRVYWYDDGVNVYTSSVEGPDRWDAGGRVFSR